MKRCVFRLLLKEGRDGELQTVVGRELLESGKICFQQHCWTEEFEKVGRFEAVLKSMEEENSESA